MLPNDLPPWTAVQQQALRWTRAGCFEAMTHDLRAILRLLHERAEEPSAVVLDGRTLQSSPESGGRAGYDGYKRKKGSKVHVAVDTLGHLLALVVTPANAQQRAQVETLAQQVQAVTAQNVELAYVDQGYTGKKSGAGGCRPWHPPGGGQTRRGQARLCPATTPLGGGTILCLAGQIPAAFPRLRTPSHYPRQDALAGFCLPSP